jgi:hypothetical protein
MAIDQRWQWFKISDPEIGCLRNFLIWKWIQMPPNRTLISCWIYSSWRHFRDVPSDPSHRFVTSPAESFGNSLNHKLIWKITIFNGKIHYNWPFSIAMLVITRGYISHQQTHVVYCSLGYHMAKPLTHQPMAICLGWLPLLTSYDLQWGPCEVAVTK